MAQLAITIRTDTAAFDDGNSEHEVARILRKLTKAYDDDSLLWDYKTLLDINGNEVGQTEYEE